MRISDWSSDVCSSDFAGCTVVLKSAPETPWTATILGRLVAEQTDIPPGVFNVLTSADPAAVGEALVADPRVDMVSFTGSTQTGRRIMASASASVKRSEEHTSALQSLMRTTYDVFCLHQHKH